MADAMGWCRGVAAICERSLRQNGTAQLALNGDKRRILFDDARAAATIHLQLDALLTAHRHSSVAQWQSIRLLTGGL